MSLLERVYKKGDEEFRIIRDENGENPRGFDNLGVIDLFDYFGFSISTTPFQSYRDKVGYIYATKEDAEKWFGIKINQDNEVEMKQKTLDVLIAEIQTLNDYYTGNVYGYIHVKHIKCEKCGNVEEKILDSCYGYYGDIDKSGILSEVPKGFEEVV